MKNSYYDKLAAKLGYQKVKGSRRSHGQAIYTNGHRFISHDIDTHTGGTWKMATSIKDLGSKSTRLGTYDKDLKRIGD